MPTATPPQLSFQLPAARRRSLVIGCYQSSGTIDPRTFSTTKDGEASFHTNAMYIAWKLYLAAPADSIDRYGRRR